MKKSMKTKDKIKSSKAVKQFAIGVIKEMVKRFNLNTFLSIDERGNIKKNYSIKS